jgi:5-methylcytosine-specific restriction endonuclease McrA
MPLKDRSRRLAYFRQYNAANIERRTAQILAWKQRNIEHWKKKQADYRLKHAEKRRVWAAEWRKNNPELHHARRKEIQMRRRALVLNVTISPENIKTFLAWLRKKTFVRCYYCKRKIPRLGAHVDHVVALANKGAHEVGNLAIACCKCNRSKGKKSLSDWSPSDQPLLPI